nr:hypothetical protein [uncultured Sphingomonas sp.]
MHWEIDMRSNGKNVRKGNKISNRYAKHKLAANNSAITSVLLESIWALIIGWSAGATTSVPFRRMGTGAKAVRPA